MDDTRTVQAAKADEAEAGIGQSDDGIGESFPVQAVSQSIPPRRSLFLCCTGVDVPGVGMTHAHNCPCSGRRFALPGDAVDNGMMPHSLGSQLLDGLLARLLFAAGDLARSRMRPRELLAMLDGDPIYSAACRECHYVRFGPNDPRQHTELCKTGRVLDLLEEILEVVPTPDLSIFGKETAPAEESRAGEGVRPCGCKGVNRDAKGWGGCWVCQHERTKGGM